MKIWPWQDLCGPCLSLQYYSKTTTVRSVKPKAKPGPGVLTDRRRCNKWRCMWSACIRRKTAAGRPASCSCTCETFMIPSSTATDDKKYQQQQHQPASQSPPVVDDYHSDWTGNQIATSDDNQLIAGHSMIDDLNTIDRQADADLGGIRQGCIIPVISLKRCKIRPRLL